MSSAAGSSGAHSIQVNPVSGTIYCRRCDVEKGQPGWQEDCTWPLPLPSVETSQAQLAQMHHQLSTFKSLLSNVETQRLAAQDPSVPELSESQRQQRLAELYAQHQRGAQLMQRLDAVQAHLLQQQQQVIEQIERTAPEKALLDRLIQQRVSRMSCSELMRTSARLSPKLRLDLEEARKETRSSAVGMRRAMKLGQVEEATEEAAAGEPAAEGLSTPSANAAEPGDAEQQAPQTDERSGADDK